MNEQKYADNLVDNICKRIMNSCAHKRDSARPSAFMAANTTTEQNVTAETPVVPVIYPNEIFDLNNEYDPVASTFTPKQPGVYSIIASVVFSPRVCGEFVQTNYRVLVTIQVNGTDVVADNDFWGILPTTTEINDATSVSAILKLNAGDKVNVTASSSMNGVFLPGTVAVYSMRFEAARFPSPLINDDPPTTSITSGSNILSRGQL